MCMAVKTITIDLEAYEILAHKKRPGQSFSQVIKERPGGTSTGRDIRALLGNLAISEKTLDGVERQIRARRGSKAKAARL
jgi:predicted CopG family antitoxin